MPEKQIASAVKEKQTLSFQAGTTHSLPCCENEVFFVNSMSNDMSLIEGC